MLAKKSLGQNFLMHRATAERIAEAAEIPPGGTVLEIGPGTGMLTRALLPRAGRVIAVEADASLIPGLEEEFRKEIGEGRLTVLHEDIREFDPSSIEGPYALVANIPYYLTGEIFRQFLSARHKPSSITVLVQKEVAERVARSKKESLLSLSVKAYGTPSYRFTVTKGSFVPSPKVDSAVLSITGIREDAFSGQEEESRFFEVLRAGFGHKRKLLLGNLSSLFGRDRVANAFTEAGIPEKARAEDIPLSSWRALSRSLSS